MHKKNSILLSAVVAGGLMLGLTGQADAMVVTAADFDFASGAEFIGQILFADDFSSVIGVNGVLSGYQDGIHGFTGAGSTLINWVWLGGFDINPSPTQVATFLMNGSETPMDFSNWISFAYDISALPNIILAPGGSGFGFTINVDYDDPMVSGSLSTIPLPPSILLLFGGLAGMAVLGRSRKKV
jgi:hypothetical protein